MGWWSATIMGGDEPLDQQTNVLELIGLLHDDEDYPDWEDEPERTKAALEAVSMDAWRAFFEQKDDFGRRVAQQVAAVMHMAVGAALPDALAQAAIGCSQQEDTRTWKDPEERRMYLDRFIAQVKAYDGTPTHIEEEGLFDVMAGFCNPRPKPH